MPQPNCYLICDSCASWIKKVYLTRSDDEDLICPVCNTAGSFTPVPEISKEGHSLLNSVELVADFDTKLQIEKIIFARNHLLLIKLNDQESRLLIYNIEEKSIAPHHFDRSFDTFCFSEATDEIIFLDNKSIYIADLVGQKEVKTINGNFIPNFVEISNCGHFLAVSSQKGVCLIALDKQSGNDILGFTKTEFKTKTVCQKVAFSKNSDIFAYENSGNVYFYNAKSKRTIIYDIRSDDITDIQFGKKYNNLCSIIIAGGIVEIVEVGEKDYSNFNSLYNNDRGQAIAWSKDDTVLIAGGDGITLSCAETAEKVGRLLSSDYIVYSMAINDRYLAAALERTAFVWKVPEQVWFGKDVQQFKRFKESRGELEDAITELKENTDLHLESLQSDYGDLSELPFMENIEDIHNSFDYIISGDDVPPKSAGLYHLFDGVPTQTEQELRDRLAIIGDNALQPFVSEVELQLLPGNLAEGTKVTYLKNPNNSAWWHLSPNKEVEPETKLLPWKPSDDIFSGGLKTGQTVLVYSKGNRSLCLGAAILLDYKKSFTLAKVLGRTERFYLWRVKFTKDGSIDNHLVFPGDVVNYDGGSEQDFESNGISWNGDIPYLDDLPSPDDHDDTILDCESTTICRNCGKQISFHGVDLFSTLMEEECCSCKSVC